MGNLIVKSYLWNFKNFKSSLYQNIFVDRKRNTELMKAATTGGGGGFFYIKGTRGYAARKGILFQTSSLGKGILSGSLSNLDNFGQRKVKLWLFL